MRIDKKVWRPLFFLFSYIVFVPIINEYLKVLEKCFQISFNTLDINFFNLIVVVFKNGTIFTIWLLLDFIIVLTIKNVILTKENLKIEVEGIRLKKKDGTFGTADWGTKEEIMEYLSIG